MVLCAGLETVSAHAALRHAAFAPHSGRDGNSAAKTMVPAIAQRWAVCWQCVDVAAQAPAMATASV